MGKVSDNVNPKLILAEGVTPASPAAGQQKLFIDSSDHKVKRVDSSGTVTTVEGGGGGSSTETYDAAITAIAGAVHRWKFEETSGATIADSIGSLNLTLSGTAGTNYNRNIAGPSGLGLATQLISARATSSGIGSLPLGAADRTVALVFRTSSQNTQQIPFTWGTSAAYQLFYISLNDSGAAAALGHMTPAVGGGSDLLDMAQVPISDGAWHLAFAGLRGGTGKNRFGYIDGIYAQGTFTTAANTVSTGSFAVSGSGSNQFIGDIADLTVFNRALSRSEMDRMFRAAFPNA